MKKDCSGGAGRALSGFGLALGVLPRSAGRQRHAAPISQLDLFSDAFERVRANYVRPVKDSELINAAIQGMVSSLDPHSSYMDAKAYGDMQITTKGQFGGVGIEVTQEDGLIKVISPIDGTPAAKAGIKPGDRIAAIDGIVHRRACRSNDAIDKMRGPAGTKITLTILREGEKKPFDVTLHARHRAGGCRHMAPRRRCRLYPPARLQRADRDGPGKGRARSARSRSAPASRAISSTCATIRAGCSIRRSRCPTISSTRRRDRLHPRPPSRRHPAL